LKQSPRSWFDKFSTIIAHYGLQQSFSNHSIFETFLCTINLAVYIDDIIITEDDHQDIIQLKAYLSSHFHMKKFGLLRYFLGIKVARSPKDLCLKKISY